MSYRLRPETTSRAGSAKGSKKASRAARPVTARKLKAVVPGSRGEVLLLTREGIDRDGVGDVLRESGYSVRVSKPDAKSLDKTLAAPPVLVLADLVENDADMTGFIYCVTHELATLAPAVIGIAQVDDEATTSAFERAFEAGVKDILSKPVPASLLRVKVARNAAKPKPMPERFGAYEIKRVLGRGAMGTVYLAKRDGSDDVALKVLDVGVRGLEPEALARFRREADVLKRLRGGETVPRFFDAGRIDDSFFVAMEFIPGDTLQSIIDQSPLTPSATARMLDEVAQTLEVIHSLGLVHRDVKPTNVIVTPSGMSKLVDFGLAKAIGDLSLTRHNEILGTAPYMAPELVREGVTNAATDAFALGMTGLEALLGHCPLKGSSYEIAEKLMRGDVPRASDWAPKCEREILEILDGLLAPVAEERLTLAEARALLQARKTMRARRAAVGVAT